MASQITFRERKGYPTESIVLGALTAVFTIISCPPAFALDIMKRTEFGYTGCTVYGWPSSGGVLIKEPADVVDLNFLGVDRLKASSRSDNIIEEDAFCNRMRQIGAKWWENEKEFIDVSIGMRDATELESRELVFGWPTSGGVWVLRFDQQKKLPRDFGRIHMASDMDERCQVIKEYGGTFYEDPKDVVELAQLS
ncbi:hypothetical protein JMJ35_006925 [Cladonia borealis]|uniref:Uncharacterized protein n=1 Tax=Cladonia borealis TaxID=184061 RepID=A0AA39UZY7_9LECA|nr:hypothetical protein JMJ35_006925 [Cladonia borealis]